MTARLAAVAMAVLLVLYLVLVVQLAVRFIAVGGPVATSMGAALIVLPLLGFWALGAELLFGIRSERLTRRLALAGRLPLETRPLLPSGRVDRSAPHDDDFDDYRREVEAAPDDWEAWFRLGLSYDAHGDRRRARASIRTAIRLERQTRSSG